ncbi:uncharacterized protein RCC_05314 [Ramularia collo-cygni]|uniref:Uncharacterized protein n=1 Tax=Ramularia collo-cygni TaxID=112498 RepID=A0A2D3VFN8_9PEZI|nr:uncharacterized protein RCC_05314 [Ramularia collo-cygni]CZT19463.1 uncharacterized protein RCC_05314 [Ramularia collo-cygni]
MRRALLRTPWFQKLCKDEQQNTFTSTATPSPIPPLLFDGDEDTAFSTRSSITSSMSSASSRLRYTAPHGALKRVIHSTYGDLLQETSVNPPKLVMVPSANIASAQALFHVRHFQQETMDFEKFKYEVLRTPELRNARWQVESHFQDVQRLYEKLPHHSNSIPYMEEFCHSVDTYDTGMVFACVPFYDLRPHGHQTEARLKLSPILSRLWPGGPPDTPSNKHSSIGHPARTLFQSLNPRNNSRRDLKQVACQMLPHRDQRYLYLSQVWFLVINHDLIITCSTLAENELYGDMLQKPATTNERPPKHKVLSIRLKTHDKNTWLLEQDDCSTYLDLAAHFSSYTTNFADDFAILEDGAEVFPHQWPDVVERSKTCPLYLVMKKREHGTDMISQEAPATAALYAALGERCFIKHTHTRSSGDESGDTASIDPEQTSSTTGELTEPTVVDNVSIQGMQESSGRLKDGMEPTSTRNHVKEARSADDKDGRETHVATPSALTRKHIQASTREALFIKPHLQARAKPGPVKTGEPAKRLSVDMSMPSLASLFDEYLLYESLKGLTTSEYNDVLSEWCNSGATTRSGIPLNFAETGEIFDVFEALGCQFVVGRHGGTGEEEIQTIQLDGWLYADLLSGLRGLLNIYLPSSADDELEAEHEKLLTAVIMLVKALDKTMASAEHANCAFAIRKLRQAFRRLFSCAREFELYSVNSGTLGRVQGRTSQGLRNTLKHVVSALVLAARAITDLNDLLPAVKSEIARRKNSVAERVTHDEEAYAYAEVKRCCGIMTDFMWTCKRPEDDASAHQQQTDMLRKKFDECAERLTRLGWEHAAARNVLYNQYGWSKVEHHADSAWTQLVSGFEALLNANSRAQIQWKAAAFPIDLMALVLPQILWRPVLGDQDALDMYNQYVTDLESNILTGDPSREPLDRIRNLRHELNAFSLLQTQQIDVLEKLVDIVWPAEDETNPDEHDVLSPHPRLAVFKALPESMKLQNSNIQQLHGMLNQLQTEATAQVSNVQDWRDNATVVFTIITIIFLPLSFVSSVFGMNTSDVRNMQLNQWVFWASAAPFTLMVILITVYFVDVPPLWRWLERTGNGDTSTGSTHQDAIRASTGNNRTGFLASVARQQQQAIALHAKAEFFVVEEKDGDALSTGSSEA